MIDKAKKPWIEISVPLRDAMGHWPSGPPVSIKRVKDIEQGDNGQLVSDFNGGAFWHTW